MRTNRLVAAVVTLLFVAAACGDGGGGAEAAEVGEQAGGPDLTTAEADDDSDERTSSDEVDIDEVATEEPDEDAEGTTSDTVNTDDNTVNTDDNTVNTDDNTGSSGQLAIEPVFLFPAAEGDSGEAVEALQSRLANLGFAPGTPDGSYGRRTTKAVAAFQLLVELEETGQADEETIAALRSYTYDGLILLAGDEGTEVEALQERLAAGPFDPGKIDGQYGTATVQAVWALEKLADLPVDGNWGPLDEKAWELLTEGRIGKPSEDHQARWVEVDLTAQLIKVYDPGESTPTLISHVSSGSGIPWSNEDHSGSSVTPTGEFEISRRIRGWRESSLNIGRLYNPLYFNGGIAFHGASSVPLYPASHGCIRLPMHVAEYLPEELPNGTTVYVDT